MMAMPCGGQAADQGVDLGLGADVDAAGRLVEEQDLGLDQEPAGEDALLLVAAGKARHRGVAAGGLDRRVLDRPTRRPRRCSARGSIKPPSRAVSSARRRIVMFSATVISVEQAERLAVLGHHGDARARSPRRGVVNRTGVAFEQDRAAGRSAARRRSASSSSVRPAPSRPATPSTSPAWSVEA